METENLKDKMLEVIQDNVGLYYDHGGYANIKGQDLAAEDCEKIADEFALNFYVWMTVSKEANDAMSRCRVFRADEDHNKIVMGVYKELLQLFKSQLK